MTFLNDVPDDELLVMQNSNNLGNEHMETNKVRKLSWREDWTGTLYLFFATTGIIASILDFAFLQDLNFQTWAIILGFIVLLFGGILRGLPRRTLLKAGFGNLMGTSRLQIVENHQLVTDGFYKHIRHPIYAGELIRNFGFALIFSSGYGILFMMIAAIFLLVRIEMEEKMLVDAFGEAYEKYQKTTKKLIPFLY